MMIGRRKSTGSEVLASTAGSDTWQTFAGRSHGPEGFELFDLFRVAKRKFNAKFVWTAPPAGTACPVCMTAPDSKADWHITSACGHAVCKDCLGAYASSLVRDPAHHGPLKCPVCPLPLRPKDAIKALGSDPELLSLWDKKIRDEVLRAFPGYRHCPRCSGNDNAQTEEADLPAAVGLVGGGFVTPECLAPINKQRERRAQQWLNHPIMTERGLGFLCALYVLVYSFQFQSSDFFVNLINVSVVPMWFLKRIWRGLRHIVAFEARKILFEPISVECPCCNEAFILNAESELGNNVITDEATQKWIGSNTRPCPQCSVPISKIDGCNHMQCAHCHAKFCWACMRVGSACAAFNCHHGAPFGNAGTPQGDGNNARDEGGIMDRIDRLTSESTRFDRSDGITLAAILMGILARENPYIQFAARALVTSFAFIFSSGTFLTVILALVVGIAVRDRRDHIIRRGGGFGMMAPDEHLFGADGAVMEDRSNIDRAIRRGSFAIRRGSAALRQSFGNSVHNIANEMFDVDGAVERSLIDEAIRRSLEDQ